MDFQIRPIREDDFLYVLAWSKEETFCLANGWELGRSEQELYEWWHCVHHLPENFLREGVEVEGRLVGYVDIADITHTAEVGIAIGDRSLWGKGLGTRVLQRQMAYIAQTIGQRIWHHRILCRNTRNK